MYDAEKDTYSCDLCGFEMGWDAHDDEHGEMWWCEKCGGMFCSKCFIDKMGWYAYKQMMQGNDLIYCPDCYGEESDTYGSNT